MQIISHVWGDKHIQIFEETMLKSLTWPKNFEALKDTKPTWNIFTEEKYFDRLLKRIPQELCPILRDIKGLMEFIDPAQSAFMMVLRKCLQTDEKLLIAPGDLLFSENSIPNMLHIGKDKGSVVVIPHMRVLPEAMLEVDHPMSGAELVTLAFKHIHQSWTDAEKGVPNQTSFHGGVTWEKLGDNLYSVDHRLPAPYLAHFTLEDLDYFESAATFNSLDHLWPGQVLVPRGRQRYVGSSDACFLIEPTERESNIPLPLAYATPGGFCQNHAHNHMNSQMRAIFRGE